MDFKNDVELQKNIDMNSILPYPLVYSSEILNKTKILFEYLTKNSEKLINFIKLIEYSITSMNCFTMIINDAEIKNLNYYYSQANLMLNKFNVTVIYDKTIYELNILNNLYIKDDAFKAKCSDG